MKGVSAKIYLVYFAGVCVVGIEKNKLVGKELPYCSAKPKH